MHEHLAAGIGRQLAVQVIRYNVTLNVSVNVRTFNIHAEMNLSVTYNDDKRVASGIYCMTQLRLIC